MTPVPGRAPLLAAALLAVPGAAAAQQNEPLPAVRLRVAAISVARENAVRSADGGTYISIRGGYIGPDGPRRDEPKPVFVVDGVLLTPERLRDPGFTAADVEKVEILKGVEATSRYGPAAMAGAVLVTTKRAAGAGSAER